MPDRAKIHKKRYIAFKVTAPREISRKEIIAAIRGQVKDRQQWDKIMPWLTVFEHNEGILRCIHTSKEEAISLLTSITHIGREKVPVEIRTLGTSGSIKKVKMKFLSRPI
ncbi:MAG: hypothetical protein JSW28_04750 [Thermoplasmata archaeon]|nr:MAG: hypothetical protein JSW28_04750 [Thermoplasmata archaeon]